MYVIPIETVVEMDKFVPHEEMKGRGDLVEWHDGLGDVVFFSHVWLSGNHPDPDGVQWSVLKAVAQDMMCGVKIRVFWQQELLFGPVSMGDEFRGIKHAWVDYISIPQAPENREMQQACIRCIYSYVHNATHFVVVAPPAMHRDKGVMYDYRTWSRRGWCRTEMFCNSIGKHGKVLVAESPTSMYIDMAGGRDALLRPPGRGDFTVDADKALLGPVLDNLVAKRILHEFEGGNLFTARLYRAGKHQVMAGLPMGESPRLDLQEWLAEYKFGTPVEAEGTGWTPFRYAVYEGRYDIAKQLLDARADVEAPLKEAVPGVGYHGKDTSVLGGLAFMRDDPEGIRFLVDNRASVHHKAENELTPLHLASVVGHLQTLKALVELGGDVHAENKFGDDSAGSAVFGGQKEAALYLIDQGSQTLSRPTKFGWLSAFSAIVCDGDTDTLKAVIELRADVNYQSRPLPGFGKIATAGCQAAYYFRWRDPSAVVDLFSQVPGMTPLGCAAHFGNAEAVSLLLDARADGEVANDYGRTPLHQAAVKGHIRALELLARAAPRALERKDCWGWTPARWAEGHRHADALEVLLAAGAGRPAPSRGGACCAIGGEVAAREAA